jgi:hypothetical protein
VQDAAERTFTRRFRAWLAADELPEGTLRTLMERVADKISRFYD